MCKIIESYKGEVDEAFWKVIYKYYGSKYVKMTPKINGWVLAFFPYIDGEESVYAHESYKQRIKEIQEHEEEMNDRQASGQRFLYSAPGIEMNKLLDLGLTKTPITFSIQKEKNMTIISGFSGATISSFDFYLRPVLSYAVFDA